MMTTFRWSPPSLRRGILGSGAGLAVAAALLLPVAADAQSQGEVVASLGAGATLYSIDTRFDSGGLIRGSVGYSPLPYLMVEGGGRWHGCFDCDRFFVVESGLQLRYPGERMSPFVAIGGGRSSDPGLMGVEWGGHASVGSWIWLSQSWGLQIEARGRQVGSGDHMGELSAGLARRFPGGRI